MTSIYTENHLVIFSELFEEDPLDISFYLSGNERAILLDVITTFLGFATQKSEFNNYENLLKTFFGPENKNLANVICSRLNKLQGERKGELIIVNPLSSLYLFEYCFNNSLKQGTQSRAETEVSVFKAYLKLNMEIAEAEQTAANSTVALSSELRPAAMSFSQAFPSSEFLNYNPKNLLASQLIKSILLFEFLENNPKSLPLLKKFLTHFSCSDWQEFLQRYLPLPFKTATSTIESYIEFHVPKNENFKKDCDFIKKLTVNDTDIIKDYDFKKIRSKPFYEVYTGCYRVIFKLFLIELTHKGLFFKLKELNDSLPDTEKLTDFRNFYTKYFSEKELLYKVIENIYHNRYKKFNDSTVNEKFKIKDGPDYYVRNGNYVFLFESKDILINSKIKLSYDFKKYEVELKKRLYKYTTEKEKLKKGAVLQFIENIKKILTKNIPYDNNYNPNLVYIYPVLILHDHQYNVVGLNKIVNNWFSEELKELKQKGINTTRVQAIIIIDIDTLILYQDLFKNNIIRLEKLIDAYISYTTFDKKRNYKNEEHAKQRFQETLMPFSAFLLKYLTDKKIRNTSLPRMLKEKGRSLFFNA